MARSKVVVSSVNVQLRDLARRRLAEIDLLLQAPSGGVKTVGQASIRADEA
jgi:hypothetical protein